MSAYVVDEKHILYLVTAAQQYGSRGDSFYFWNGERTVNVGEGLDMSPDEFGQMLWNENKKSVGYRYNEDALGSGLARLYWEPYRHQMSLGRVEPVQVLKAISCYEYQTCEHPEWDKWPEARWAVQWIKEGAIRALPGYEEAEWGGVELAPFHGVALSSLM